MSVESYRLLTPVINGVDHCWYFNSRGCPEASGSSPRHIYYLMDTTLSLRSHTPISPYILEASKSKLLDLFPSLAHSACHRHHLPSLFSCCLLRLVCTCFSARVSWERRAFGRVETPRRSQYARSARISAGVRRQGQLIPAVNLHQAHLCLCVTDDSSQAYISHGERCDILCSGRTGEKMIRFRRPPK